MPAFYFDVDWNTHNANFNTNYAQGLRPTAIAMREAQGVALYSAAWLPNDGRYWETWSGVDYQGLLQWIAKWQAQGYEMKVLTSTESLFSAVMEKTNVGTVFVSDLADGPSTTPGTLAYQLNAYQKKGSNYVPRAIAIYGSAGAARRYAVVFEPCQENWSYRFWDTDIQATQARRAFFDDLMYRPTLLGYSPEGTLFSVYRDDSIGPNNWACSNGQSGAEVTATYNTLAGRGLWALSLSASPGGTFASVFVTTETPCPRELRVVGSDVANLSSTFDPIIIGLMQSSQWPNVGQL